MRTLVSSGAVHLHAYAERLSVRAGEDVRIMASIEGVAQVEARLVRLVHGDQHPDGPGFIEEVVDNPVNGFLSPGRQSVQRGNFLVAEDPAGRLSPGAPFTFHAFIHPTLPGSGTQALFCWRCKEGQGPAVLIDEAGRLAFSAGAGTADPVALSRPLAAQLWYFVAVSVDPAAGQAVLRQRAVLNRYNSLWSRIVPVETDAAATFAVPPVRPVGSDGVIVGARFEARDAAFTACFNGKIDRFGLLRGNLDDAGFDALAGGGSADPATVLAAWNTSLFGREAGIGDLVVDTGPFGLHARGFNRPVRGQTGWNWSGRVHDFRLAPEQYGGIEFHEDALTDCGWQPSATISLPAAMRSGVYALRLSSGDGEEDVVERAIFFVRPPTPRASLCLLMPTATYLAYANGPRGMEGDVGQAVMGRVPVLSRRDIEACENGYAFGLSTYDTHRDGVGVCHSSARRPIFTMQPDYRNPGTGTAWGLAADLSILAWLDHCGYDYDILTDQDLDQEGAAALAPYRTVINGSHAEYYSERMLDATEDYLEAGGRLLYLSGNGYYWVVAFRLDEPWIMEVRRGQAGSRAWQGRPGETHLATTGEPGGLWRNRGRPPQKLVGTGFAAEGFDVSVPYRRLAASRHPDTAWIFDGVDGGRFGDFGLAHNGAVGLEIDRYDPALGSPPNAVRLATSEPLTSNWPIVQEEVMFNHPGLGGDENEMVRCDMVYFATRNRGAVFAPSSIAWASALPVRNFDNDVSRIMRNVVDAFLRDGPLPEAGEGTMT